MPFDGGLDQALAVASTPLESWVEGGQASCASTSVTTALLVPRGVPSTTVDVSPRHCSAYATVNANADGDAEIGVTEAYLEYRPVPRSPWQRRWRFGAFYPHVSLENAGAGLDFALPVLLFRDQYLDR
jgi:hypothetical protein